MSVAAVAHYMMPDTPYNMWVRGELAAYLHLPNDGTRVEVIGGEILVSPGPTLGHNGIVLDIQEGLFAARTENPAFPWRGVQTTDLNLFEVGDGYIPDLIVVETEILAEARLHEARYLLARQVDLVVDVTSPSNARHDREPSTGRSIGTKWSGYAYADIPYYLLIDRDPAVARSVLYGEPNRRTGKFHRALAEWKFGEEIQLPEPFGFSVSTKHWNPWAE